MKSCKKLAALVLTAILACGLSISAFAEDTKETSGDTDLIAIVPSTYDLTIPADQEIAYDQAVNNLSGTLSVTGNIVSAKEVVVTVNAADELTCTLQKDTTIPFILSEQGKTDAFEGASWSADQLRTKPATSYALAVNVESSAWHAAKAGEYTAKIVFTADLKDITVD